MLKAHKFAVFVGAGAYVHEERRALRRANVMLFHVYTHIYGALARYKSYSEVRFVCRGHFISERRAHVVLNHADL